MIDFKSAFDDLLFLWSVVLPYVETFVTASKTEGVLGQFYSRYSIKVQPIQ